MSNQQSMKNIKVDHIKINVETLEFLLKRQKELDAIYGQQVTDTWEQKQYWLLKKWMAMEDELNEFKNWLSWKWWSKRVHPEGVAIREMKFELIDLLHFWLSSAITLEMTAQEIVDIYNAKNKENYARQDRGY